MIELPALTFELSVGWIQRLASKYAEIATKRTSELDSIGDVFGDCRLLTRWYVEPDCQQFSPADVAVEDGPNVVQTPVFRHLERTFMGGDKRHGTGQNQLFVLADAGMGKSSLMVMLKLAQLASFWPTGYDCILLKLGAHTLDEVRGISARRTKVLLLDALDEDPLAIGRIRDRVVDLLKETTNFHRVIITCRTQFFSAEEDPFNRRGQLEVGGFLCPVVFLSLFDARKVNQYLSKRFPRGWKDLLLLRESPKIGMAQSIVDKMQSLRCRPMLLAHIEDLMETPSDDWTVYTIYDVLVRVWLRREQTKIGLETTAAEDLWAACRILALRLHTTGAHTVSASELEELVNDNPEIRHIRVLDFGGRSLLNKTSSGHYRFAHRSVQEFLVANSLVVGAATRSGRIRATDQIVVFLHGGLRLSTTAGRVDLGSVDFTGMDLGCMNLRSVTLQRTGLRGANLSQANLEGTMFRGAIVDTATRWPSGFSVPSDAWAIGPDSNLVAADLAGADLTGADLCGVDLRRATLTDARIQDARVDYATYLKSRWTPALLRRLKARGAVIVGIETFPNEVLRAAFGDPTGLLAYFRSPVTFAVAEAQRWAESVDCDLAETIREMPTDRLEVRAWDEVALDRAEAMLWTGDIPFPRPAAVERSAGLSFSSGTMAGSPPEHTGRAAADVARLLASMFTGTELRIAMEERWAGSSDDMPGRTASLADLSDYVVARFRRHGERFGEVWAWLVELRPGREREISEVIHRWSSTRERGARPPDAGSSPPIGSGVASSQRWPLYIALVSQLELESCRSFLRVAFDDRVRSALAGMEGPVGGVLWNATAWLDSNALERAVQEVGLSATTLEIGTIEGSELSWPEIERLPLAGLSKELEESIQLLLRNSLFADELRVVLEGACGIQRAALPSTRGTASEVLQFAIEVLKRGIAAELFVYIASTRPARALAVADVRARWSREVLNARPSRWAPTPNAAIRDGLPAGSLIEEANRDLSHDELRSLARRALTPLAAAWLPGLDTTLDELRHVIAALVAQGAEIAGSIDQRLPG